MTCSFAPLEHHRWRKCQTRGNFHRTEEACNDCFDREVKSLSVENEQQNAWGLNDWHWRTEHGYSLLKYRDNIFTLMTWLMQLAAMAWYGVTTSTNDIFFIYSIDNCGKMHMQSDSRVSNIFFKILFILVEKRYDWNQPLPEICFAKGFAKWSEFCKSVIKTMPTKLLKIFLLNKPSCFYVKNIRNKVGQS